MFTGELCPNCDHRDFIHILKNDKCDFSKYGGGESERARTGEHLCECPGFISPTIMAINELPRHLKLKLACAEYLELNPNEIMQTDVAGYSIRWVDLVLSIPDTPEVSHWIVNNLPKENTPQIQKFVAKK